MCLRFPIGELSPGKLALLGVVLLILAFANLVNEIHHPADHE